MKIDHAGIWLMIIASTFFWGSNFNAGHAIAGDVTPLAAAAERFAIALLGFWILRFAWGRAESTLLLRDYGLLIALGLIGVFGFNYAFFTAMHTTSALNAALIMALSPLISSLLSVWLLKVQIGLQQYCGILLAFAGVILVITGGNIGQLNIGLGDSWMLLACSLWSCYNVGSKKFASHIPPLQFARWTVSVGAIALILTAEILENPLVSLPQAHPITHWILVYMAILGTLLAYIFWIKGVYVLGPAKSAIAFNLVPVFTLIVSLILGTLPDKAQVLGLIIVLAGVWIASGRQIRYRVVN